MVWTCGKTREPSRRMLKKSRLLTRPTQAVISPARPESAKTDSSPWDAPCPRQGRSELSLYKGWVGLSQLRAPFSPAHPLADIFHPPHPPIASQSISRDVPFARARAFRFFIPLLKGVAKAALNCAHRTSTVSSCAFCEQGGHLAAPFSSFGGRALREQGDRPIYPIPPFQHPALARNIHGRVAR